VCAHVAEIDDVSPLPDEIGHFAPASRSCFQCTIASKTFPASGPSASGSHPGASWVRTMQGAVGRLPRTCQRIAPGVTPAVWLAPDSWQRITDFFQSWYCRAVFRRYKEGNSSRSALRAEFVRRRAGQNLRNFCAAQSFFQRCVPACVTRARGSVPRAKVLRRWTRDEAAPVLRTSSRAENSTRPPSSSTIALGTTMPPSAAGSARTRWGSRPEMPMSRDIWGIE
jgi:hypothetical protein